MENLLKKELSTTLCKPFGFGSGGCISSGQGYKTDQGNVFVKTNGKGGADIMFEGEFASLEAILKTNTVRVPKPLKVFPSDRHGSVLVMEYINFGGLHQHAAKLGEQLARLHLHNHEKIAKIAAESSSVHREKDDECVVKFGFQTRTCCGFIPQENDWEEDWVDFYTRHKLKQQVDMIEQEYGDRDLKDLWSHLVPKIPNFFQNVQVMPSLLHGDLWGGNAGETADEPVIFDAASFYGHGEYDLGIATMFGGFGSTFFTAYHKIIPKADGFQNRNQLYQLFHYLNHWNHFGSGYRGQSLQIMRQLIKK